MDNNDMSEIAKKLASMLNNTSSKEIPDNLKDILSSFSSNSSNSSNNTYEEANNIDINTIMKMQEIVKAMNSESQNSRSNLLRSLKPYLKPSRQDKVEQYIQLLNIEKVFNLLNNNNK